MCYVYIAVRVCVCHMCAGAQPSQRKSDDLGLDLEAMVESLM